jgi:hypothetical protein
MVGPLDMALDSDRRVLSRSVTDGVTNRRKRWEGVTDEMKANAVKALTVALRMSLEKQDHRAINGCVKTLALLEGQNQADDHMDRKEAMGRPQNNVNVNVAVGIDMGRVMSDPKLHDAASRLAELIEADGK